MYFFTPMNTKKIERVDFYLVLTSLYQTNKLCSLP